MTLQKLETIQNTGMILIGGFAKTTYSCYGSNHGNGKPMTQKVGWQRKRSQRASSTLTLWRGQTIEKSYSTTRRRWNNTFQFPGTGCKN
jgi:hypothetical protein